MCVRGATFIGALLLAWVSLRPFVDLGDTELKRCHHRQRDADLCWRSAAWRC